jgi:hypothetical protein
MFACVSLLTAIFTLGVVASDLPVTPGLSALPKVEFSRLSQRDTNPLAEKALAIDPDEWKHGETDHFIYHFRHSYVVTPISVEAEFHYRVVTKELEREQSPGDTKSHIYIFEQPDDWKTFQANAVIESWTGGIHSEGSLFILRDPAYKFATNLLGHEIAHLVVHRFYGKAMPTWLDEGFAQYVSKGARASYQRARGYLARPLSQSIAAQDLIPLSALFAMAHPPSDRVETFYDESERLVRLLAVTDKPGFLALLQALGQGQSFETAFLRVYAGKFASVSALEEKFREYASKDFGSSLQQADSE